MEFRYHTKKSDFLIIETSPGTYNVPPAGYGGSERAIFGLSKALTSMVPVKVLDFGKKTCLKRIRGVSISILRNPLRLEVSKGLFIYNLNAVTSAFILLLHLIKERSFNKMILHFHHGAQFSTFWLLQKLFLRSSKVSYAYSNHSPKWMQPRILSSIQRFFAVPTELFSIEHSALVTFESNILLKQLSVVCRVSSPIMVLPNGVDTEVLDRQRFKVVQDPFKVFYGARVKRQKDQMTVIKAMSLVRLDEPKAKLILLGDPEELDYYQLVKEEVAKLHMNDAVEFHPSLSFEQLNLERAKCAIHVIYSSFAGFDVSLGETFSMGAATVLSDIPPLKGIAENNVNCLLVSPSNCEELAAAIIRLIKEPNLRKRLSAGARKTAEEKLSWNVLAARFVEKTRRTLI